MRQLLSAVGLDQTITHSLLLMPWLKDKTKDSWIWFLQLLDNDIGFEDQHAWTFMSDKQKGLILSFEHLFPNIENRFCVRHLHSNMKHDGF